MFISIFSNEIGNYWGVLGYCLFISQLALITIWYFLMIYAADPNVLYLPTVRQIIEFLKFLDELHDF